MSRTPWSASAVVIAGIASGCVVDDEPVVTAAESEIKNGTPWNPWTQSTQTWTRNIVQLRGCTGTLLTPEWVISASHCFGQDADPASVTAQHLLANGTTESSTGVEILRHPTSGVDVALLRLAEPLTPGVAALELEDDYFNVVGLSVFCAGYGAMAASGSCEVSDDCSSGQFCEHGLCMTPTDGLRSGTFTTITDTDQPLFWHQLDVPNAQGQMLMPRDSGSSCFNGSKITGIHKAGNGIDYNRLTNAFAAREWVESRVRPTLLKEANQPATRCRSTSSADLAYDAAGAAENPSAGTLAVVCPISRAIEPDHANYVTVPKIWVTDRSSSSNICCTLRSRNASGAEVESPMVCSTGSSADYQTLALSAVYDDLTYSHASVRCTLPGETSSGKSRIHGFRTRLAHR